MGKKSSDSAAAPTGTPHSSDGPRPSGGEAFTPVAVRARHDGWSPERQHGFIAALAESGCVAEACAAVSMSTASAYALRARPDASTFRQAWDVALDYAIRRLGDAALSRALHGVARPVFYKGEQVGERIHYDERLTMFLLRYRDPVRYGAWLDAMEARRHPDGAGIVLAHALNKVLDAAYFPDTDPEGQEEQDSDPSPLAEGPPPPDRVELPDYDGPEELRDFTERLRAASNAHARAQENSDPSTADWRAVLPVRRPRRASKRNVP